MTFIKDQPYHDIKTTLFEYFQNNFKTEKEGSHPSDYNYYVKDIPNSYFIAVDVHAKAGQFLRRYLIVAIQNGNATKNTPESYSQHLDFLCDLPNPTGTTYNQGIAVILVDENIQFPELLLQKELRQINCGS